MPGAFQSDAFQNDAFQVEVVKTGTGGIDPAKRSIKPTGILHRPKKESRKEVSDRVDESREIQAEIAGRLAREFGEETTAQEISARARPPVREMTLAEVEAEIGVLLRKKIRTQEDEILMLLLIAATA